MTASRLPIHRTSFTSPVVDYEPAPVGVTSPGGCAPRTSAALHRHNPRRLRPIPAATAVPARAVERLPPRAAAVFVDGALRRVLEVTDRRRPAMQLRQVLTPTLFDAMTAHTRVPSREGAAVLRRVRLRAATIVDDEATAAEVFATYTRGRRVRAIAGRVELRGGRWVLVALQIG